MSLVACRQECLRHVPSTSDPKVSGKCRRGTQGCVRHEHRLTTNSTTSGVRRLATGQAQACPTYRVISFPFRFTSSNRKSFTFSITSSCVTLPNVQCAIRTPLTGAFSYPRRYTARLLVCDVIFSTTTLLTTGLNPPPRPSRLSYSG